LQQAYPELGFTDWQQQQEHDPVRRQHFLQFAAQIEAREKEGAASISA